MKQQRSGRIMNMSSVVGRKAFARSAGYSPPCTIAGFSDALRQEAAGGNRRLVISPGADPYNTSCWPSTPPTCRRRFAASRPFPFTGSRAVLDRRAGRSRVHFSRGCSWRVTCSPR